MEEHINPTELTDLLIVVIKYKLTKIIFYI